MEEEVLWCGWTDDLCMCISHRKAWRRRCYDVGERMISVCVFPTVKHGGGGVMVWRCFAGDTVCDLQWLNKELKELWFTVVEQRIEGTVIYSGWTKNWRNCDLQWLNKELKELWFTVVAQRIEGTVIYSGCTKNWRNCDLQWLHKELKEGVPIIVAHIYLRKIFVLYLQFIFSLNYFTLIKSMFCSYLPRVPILVEGTVKYLGTCNQHGYHSILQWYAIPSGLGLVGLSFVNQQDNDPTHLQAV
jgi:hypothetical protein